MLEIIQHKFSVALRACAPDLMRFYCDAACSSHTTRFLFTDLKLLFKHVCCTITVSNVQEARYLSARLKDLAGRVSGSIEQHRYLTSSILLFFPVIEEWFACLTKRGGNITLKKS